MDPMSPSQSTPLLRLGAKCCSKSVGAFPMSCLSSMPTAASISALVATDSNLSASSLVEHVLSQYALGVIARCRLHSRGLNDTYKVESKLGDSYYLRVYCTGWRSRESIETEVEILLHLVQQKVNVSAPVSRT